MSEPMEEAGTPEPCREPPAVPDAEEAQRMAACDEPTVTATDGIGTSEDDLKSTLGFLLPSPRGDAWGRIGDYDVLGVVGQGGMGIVLKAFDIGLSRTVAIKVPTPQLASSRRFRERFLREGRSVASISHPSVVTVHAVGEQNDLPFLVMEYIAGRTLRDRINAGAPLQTGDVVRIAAQIAEGLDAAHRRGVIHRDIKPSNIMLEDGVERAKITDFGLARAALDQSGLTSVGQVVGTPAFMAPEQLCEGKTDARSDLFSLGCVMYAMVTGHSPFRGSHTLEIIHKVSDLQPPRLDKVRPGLPPALSEVASLLLEKDPARRYQSAADAAADLTGMLMQLNLGSQASGRRLLAPLARLSTPPARRTGRVVLALVGMVLLAAAGTSPYWVPRVIDGDGPGRASGAPAEAGLVVGGGDGLPAATPPPAIDNRSADRRAADWVLGAGGQVDVAIDGATRTVERAASLPPADLQVVGIDLSQCASAAGGLQRLEKLSHLRVLKLYDVPVADDDLRPIAGLTSLAQLDLYHAHIGDDGLTHLAGLQRLESLSIHGTQVTDDGLARIAGLRELQALNLAMTNVSDTGLQYLAPLTGLRWLQLSRTRVTDAGLEQLTDLHSLSELYLQGTAVTERGVARLEAALPDCTIHIDAQKAKEE